MRVGEFTGERLAIVAITRRGAELGRLLKALLPQSHLYLPDKLAVNGQSERPFPLPASSLIESIFGSHRYLVLIMAVGIAVRLVAPRVRDKRQDPGVVVMDDSGKFVVSLLSGHSGGANELTRRVASLVGAEPVVTTASETGGTVSLDLLARSAGWEIEDDSALTRVSAALVNGEPVGVYQDAGETGWQQDELLPHLRVFPGIEALRESACRAAVLITDRLLDSSCLLVPAVVYRPRSLVLGVGCNRGTGCADIEEAVTGVFAHSGLSTMCIRNLATIELKRDEPGLLEFAAKWHLPVEYFDRERLRGVTVPSGPSPVTLRHVGVPAVCEAAAILSSGGSLVVPKVSFKRMVTCSVARLSFQDRAEGGKLFLVGTGPGGPEHMTLKARQVIAQSEVVVGYRTYIDLIRPLLPGKEIVATAMGGEVERANQAIDLASRGKTVSLVSGGDSGVYGMAGLVGEILHQRGCRVSVEMVPGVPAMIAAGALLGSPLSGDAAYVSLSNHLVLWKKIAQRLRAAAKGDFVIALYNPKSRARQRQLEEAREIVLRYRSPSTPVGIVANAYRRGQSVTITDLEHMLGHLVDMNTLVIIGNSGTFISDGGMVTPRGYKRKYSLREE